MSLREKIGAFVEAPKIQNFITVVIVLNAITLDTLTSALEYFNNAGYEVEVTTVNVARTRVRASRSLVNRYRKHLPMGITIQVSTDMTNRTVPTTTTAPSPSPASPRRRRPRARRPSTPSM